MMYKTGHRNTVCILSVEGTGGKKLQSRHVAKPADVKYRYRLYFVYKSV